MSPPLTSLPLITSLIYKNACSSSIFLILVTIKKFIDLKSKTKYIGPKKIAQLQKLPIIKLKKIKLNRPILSK